MTSVPIGLLSIGRALRISAPFLHHFCTIFRNSPITNLVHERLALHLRENGAICTGATEAPVHRFAETPISPSVSRVIKSFQGLSGINFSPAPAPEKSSFSHDQQIQNPKSKISPRAGKIKVKSPVKFGKPGLQLLAPTIAQYHFNRSATVNKW
jgi:hypothetical protein